jgi:CheY-like chemotaxis protein
MKGILEMLRFGLGSYHSILEIQNFSKNNKVNQTITEARNIVKIAVIDDEKFAPLGNLKSYGYDIKEIQDLLRIEEARYYDIILCDLMGVGEHFDRTLGGASLIKEIKINYPTKIVIAYSGATSNSNEAISAKEYCDDFVRKDADLTDWTEVLDDFVAQVIDPYQMWIKLRQELFNNDIDIRDVVRLESAYVESIASKDVKFE